jgi:hypothetical protein
MFTMANKTSNDKFYSLKRHHLLDLGNRLTGIETLGARP